MLQVNISQQTISILKSFSQINSNLLVRGGNKIQTIAPTKTVLGTYEATETFPDFAIYDLPEFIGVLSLFKNPTLMFDDNHVNITDGHQTATYFFANPSTFKVVPPEKDVVFGDPDVVVDLDESAFNTILKAAATLKVGEIAFASDGDGVALKAFDLKNPTSNQFKIDVGSHSGEAEFNLIMKIENLRLVGGSYKVELSKAKIAKMTHTEVPLHYFVALQSESTYN
jgi:hypothetical protein